MKRIFSKRSGFTLVEIIIAFAIFAIMASMIVQVLNLMVRRKTQNKRFEDNLSVQEQAFVARPKDMNYTASEADGKLTLQFKDKSGSDLHVDDIDFQLKNWDPDNARNGINYFVGDYEYEMTLGGSQHFGDEDPDGGDDADPNDLGGSTQMSRFDTRITGTKGILTVTINMTQVNANTISVTVQVDDSKVAQVNKSHSQVSIFFAEGKSGGKAFEIASVNGGNKSQSSLKRVKLCGKNGVNIHCTGSNGFDNSTEVFTVEFKENVSVADIKFGESSPDGKTYQQFKVGDTVYFNIFGAFTKAGNGTGTVEDPNEGEEGEGENPNPNPGGDTGDNGENTGGNTGDNGGNTGGNTGDNGGNTGGNTGDNGGNTGGNTGDNGGNTGGNTGDNGGNTGGNTGDNGGNETGGGSMGGETTPGE